MKSLFLTADRIHDGFRFLPQGTVLEMDEDGRIIALHGAEMASKAEHHNGILCPGFINAHCHLELSHLKDVIPQHTGLIPFLQAVVRQRALFSDEQRKAARHDAYNNLVQNGVVAVGDIANGIDTIDLRTRGELHLHTFIECIGFDESRAGRAFDAAGEVYDAFTAHQPAGDKIATQTIAPHAPYSVSEKLMRMIDAHDERGLLSVHNGESEAEAEWFRSGMGAVRDLLEGLKIPAADYKPSGKSSLSTYSEWLSETHPLLLVHNTFVDAEDVRWAKVRFPQLFWVLCPGANLYIEGRLPDVPMFVQEGADICLGTDSLASNTGLSILAEMQHLKKAFPELQWEDLLRWGTSSGAKALRMDNRIGSFGHGKQPGVLLLDHDYQSVRRLI